MSVSSSSSKESSSSSLESARARTASRLSTGAAHGRSATRDTARAGAHFRPTCWRPTLCLAATVALGARREVAIAPTSRGFGDARVTHEGRCDSGANPRTSAGWASRSARRLRPAASLLRSLGNKGRLTDPFSTSPLDGSTNPGFCCLCALPARFIFSKACPFCPGQTDKTAQRSGSPAVRCLRGDEILDEGVEEPEEEGPGCGHRILQGGQPRAGLGGGEKKPLRSGEISPSAVHSASFI